MGIKGLLSFWIILPWLILWLVLIIAGSFHIRWNFFLDALHRNPVVGEQYIALTFDDGPDPDFTPKVLKILKEHRAKASFFCIGKKMEKYPELVQQILDEGHTVGNHSYSHQNSFGFLNTSGVAEEIEKTNQIFKGITGRTPRFFRPPFGVTNPNIAKAVHKTGMFTFGWSIRSLDTIAKDPDKVVKKIISKTGKGEVILLHDTSELSTAVLRKVLQYLDQNQYRTVTLDKLFNLEPYA